MPTAIRPTAIETRLADDEQRDDVAAQVLSVPSQCAGEGGCSLCGMSRSIGQAGVQTNESRASTSSRG